MFGFIFNRNRLPIQHLSINEQRRITDLRRRCYVSLERIKTRKRIKNAARRIFHNKIVPAYINNPAMRDRIFGVSVGTIRFSFSDVEYLSEWEVTRSISREIYTLAYNNDMTIKLDGMRGWHDEYYWHMEVKCDENKKDIFRNSKTVKEKVQERELENLFEGW